MKRMNGAIIVFMLGAFAAAGLAAAPKVETGKQKVWMRSGRRYSLSALEGIETRFLPGAFTAFCSARDVRSLAYLNDTLWIGTEGGLFTYGISDDTLAPASGPASLGVTAIAADDGGALWVGSDYGLSVRSGGRWKHYAKEANGIFGRVRCLVPGETRFWIGTYGNGCGYVVNDALTVLTQQDSLLDERVLSVAEESPRVVFFGTASGLVMADSLGWKSLRYGARLPIGAVKDMLFDEEENLFLAVAEQGVTVYSFGRVRTFGAEDSLPGSEINALSLDPTSRVWAAGNSGLSIFNGSEWSPYTVPGGEGRNRYRYRSIRHDVDGNCYAGTDGGKVLVISRDAVKELALPQAFPEDRVERIHTSNGTVWILTGQNIYSYRGSFVKQTPPPGLYAGEITDMTVGATGEIWATSRFGILHFEGRAWEVFDKKQGLPTEYFVSVSRDPEGNLWFQTFDRGLVEYSAGRWITIGVGGGSAGDAVQDMILDAKGTPWVVTGSGGIARYVQGEWEELVLPSFAPQAADTTQTADSLLRIDPAIRFLPGARRDPETLGGSGHCRLGRDSAGALLVATRDGIFKLTASAWQGIEYPPWRRQVEPTAVLGSARGELWVGTAGEGLLVWRNGEWFAVTASQGLSDDYVRALSEDQRGNIWIGTQFGGITRFTPQGGM
jgi:ligand-binding sensor domain-containing protein